jgi:ATP-dependent Clp protease ATP-binding subunit ClpA
MFERFSVQARQAVVAAQEHARRLGAHHIGTQHLLLGLIAHPATLSARLLADHGLDAATAQRILTGMAGDDSTDLDADALAAIGIDLNAVRDRVEATFGPGALDRPRGRRWDRRGNGLSGHLPLTRRAKRSLELALREAQRLHHGYLGDGHLLLGLVGQPDCSASRIIVAAGIDPDQLRAELEQQLPPDVAASAG